MDHLHASPLSRRGFCLCCLGSATFAATGGWLTPRAIFAQAQGIVQGITAAAAAAPIRIHRLRDGISMLEGSGGNVAVSAGPDGKVLVDAGIAVSRPQFSEALESLGPEPVTQLINTHWHFDHTSGNEWLHELGPAILAHENTRKHLSTMTRVEDWDYDFPPLVAGAVPGEVFADERILRLNGAIELKHHASAHTDSDIVATFPEQAVVHTGDLYWSAGYPFIDRSTGGNIGGKIRAIEAILAAVGDDTIIIPGHGPISDKAGLARYHVMLSTIRDRVAALKAQGRTEGEAIAAAPTAPFDVEWGQYVIDPGFFTRLIYADV